MSGPKPTRDQGDLAEMLDTLLDKGVVINADVAVTVGDTELLGVKLRAAIASFETAAEYGLAFPSGTDMQQVHAAAGIDEPAAATDAAGIPGPSPSSADRESAEPTGGTDRPAPEVDGTPDSTDAGGGGE